MASYILISILFPLSYFHFSLFFTWTCWSSCFQARNSRDLSVTKNHGVLEEHDGMHPFSNMLTKRDILCQTCPSIAKVVTQVERGWWLGSVGHICICVCNLPRQCCSNNLDKLQLNTSWKSLYWIHVRQATVSIFCYITWPKIEEARIWTKVFYHENQSPGSAAKGKWL